MGGSVENHCVQLRFRGTIPGIVVLVLTFACFANTLYFEFLNWDDDFAITRNPILTSLDWPTFKLFFTAKEIICRFMPFSFLSWALLNSLFGIDPFYFHFANVLFHSFSAFALFLVFREILAAEVRESKCELPLGLKKAASLWAAGGALLWSIHPLRVEAVARASNLTYCASTFFLFVSFYLNLRSIQGVSFEPRRRFYYLASLGCFALSLLFFGTGISLPGLLILIHFYFAPKGALYDSQERKKIVRAVLPFILMAAIAGIMNYSAHFQPLGTWSRIENFVAASWHTQLGRAAFMSVYFLVKNFSPVNLMPANPALLRLHFNDWQLWLSLLSIFAVSALLWQRRQDWRGPAFLWLAYWLAIAPVLVVSIERLPFLCDRHSHLLSVVWAFALVQAALWASSKWLPAIPERNWLILFFSLPLGYASATLPQTQIWENSVALFEYNIAALKDDPYRYDFYPRLAIAYLQNEKPKLAIPLLKEALARSKTRKPQLIALLGNAYQMQDMWGEAEAAFRELIAIMPRMENYRALAMAQLRLGKRSQAKATYDTAQASDHLTANEKKELSETMREAFGIEPLPRNK